MTRAITLSTTKIVLISLAASLGIPLLVIVGFILFLTAQDNATLADRATGLLQNRTTRPEYFSAARIIQKEETVASYWLGDETITATYSLTPDQARDLAASNPLICKEKRDCAVTADDDTGYRSEYRCFSGHENRYEQTYSLCIDLAKNTADWTFGFN